MICICGELEMNNDVLFENDKVSVNAAFFNAGTAQFPIRNIGSIHVVPESPSRQLPLLLLGLSFLVMMGASVSHQGMGTFIGLLMLAGSIWWLVSLVVQKTQKKQKGLENGYLVKLNASTHSFSLLERGISRWRISSWQLRKRR
jgi:Family of unknown function (DUF6232)